MMFEKHSSFARVSAHLIAAASEVVGSIERYLLDQALRTNPWWSRAITAKVEKFARTATSVLILMDQQVEGSKP